MNDRQHSSTARRVSRALASGLVGLALVAGRADRVSGQGATTGHEHGSTPSEPKAAEPERRATMEELHRLGGVPRGWKFGLPGGEPAKGRQIFVDLECYKCHAITGETFPAVSGDDKNVGPELTGMGAVHPAEYLAEAILAPNAVIVTGPGYTGPDGRSIMPSFAESLSVTQLLDLVAYLKGLKTGGPDHPAGAVEREQLVGDYRVRLVYERGPGGHDGGGHSAGGQHSAGQPGDHGTQGHRAVDHLMAFIHDRETAEAVPYLAVTAIVHVAAGRPRSIPLAPMAGDRGFHYGANVTLPAGTQKITLAIGATTMRVLPSARGRYTKPVSAAFEWSDR